MVAALAKRLGVAHHGFQVLQPRTLQAQKLVVNRAEALAHHIEPGLG